MNLLASGPYIHLSHPAAGATDSSLIASVGVAMAIALAAVVVYPNRSVKTQAPRERERGDARRKAA